MLVQVTGKHALFSRSEMKAERVTYDCMTSAAAVGVLRCIYWKPEMRYVINKIHVLNRPRYETVTMNNQTGAISGKEIEKACKGEKDISIDRKKNSTPRTERVLKDVGYIIDFDIELTGEATQTNTVKKHEEIFKRRAEKGQWYEQPCLGVREFTCDVQLVDHVPESQLKGRKELGLMYHHMDYSGDAPQPVFFEAVMEDGVVNMDLDKAPGIGSHRHGWFFQELVTHYEDTKEKYGLPSPGYSREKITFEAVIDKDGNMLSFNPMRVNDKGKNLPELLSVPEFVKNRTSGIKPNFIYDNASYCLAMDAKNGKEKQTAFKKKIKEVMRNATFLEIQALYKFLDTDNEAYMDKILPYEKQLTGNIIFSFGKRGNYIHELPAVKQAWKTWYESSRDGRKGICIVTGKEDIIAEAHPLIKGVAGASTFAKLVSVDSGSPAFFSYGKKGLENSEFGEYAVYAYSTMLNYLLSVQEHRVSLGNTTFVFWSEHDNEALLKKIKSLLTGFVETDNTEETDDIPIGEHFYIAGLKGNSSRIFVPYYQEFVYGRSREDIEDFCLSIKKLYKDVKLTQNWDYISGWEEKTMEKETQAYALGSLFAVLEKAQKDAVPSTKNNKTIADRYIDRASRCPSTIFPKLLADSVHHTNKVDYGSSRRIKECMDKLDAYTPAIPERLKREEQGDFFIGYYQTRDSFFKKKEEKEEKVS